MVVWIDLIAECICAVFSEYPDSLVNRSPDGLECVYVGNQSKYGIIKNYRFREFANSILSQIRSMYS
jgi:hypothetical protein